jgi:hypothetical protein
LITLAESQQSFRNYFAWIAGSSRHGSDSKLINYKSWIDYIFEVYFQGEMFIFLLLLLTVLIVILKIALSKVSKDSINLQVLLPFGLGAATIIPIILFVERLWGFYLWFGSIFLVLTIHNLVKRANLKVKELLVLLLIWMATFIICKVNPIEFSQTEVRSAFTVESSPDFKLQKLRFTKLVKILESESPSLGQAKTVAFDPLLWIPESTGKYQINPFWGPYTDWENPVDILVFTEPHTTDITFGQDRNSPAREIEIAGYREFVARKGFECTQKHCYIVAHQFGGVVVLKLRS